MSAVARSAAARPDAPGAEDRARREAALIADPLAGELRQELGEAVLAIDTAVAEGSPAAGALLAVEVRCGEIDRVAGVLCGRFRFTFLVDLCAVDEPGRPQRFQVVYHLYSFRENRLLRLRVRAAPDQPVPSVSGVWRAARWLEREAHEMVGVAFSGHPDLTPLLLWEGFQGHPLQKDFPLAGHAAAPPSEDGSA